MRGDKNGFRFSTFCWISVIRLPDFITKENFDWAVETATKKKKLDCSRAEFLTIEEGLCVQIMHIGPFDDEPATVEIMNQYLSEKGYENDFSKDRIHHEIYLSDARKVAPEKWKTVIRHPIKLKERKKMKIETKRLIITDFTMDMAQAVHENSLDEENRKFVPDEVFETVADAAETIEFLMSAYDDFEEPQVHPIITKDKNENIGYVQLVPLDNDEWEVGYHIGEKYRNSGYATEAVTAFLPVMAKKVGVKVVYGICLADNKASIRVMDKCGFAKEFEGIGEYQGQEQEIYSGVWSEK